MNKSETTAAQATLSTLTALGQPWPGIAGTYAGVTTDKTGALYALVLVDAKLNVAWRPAMNWAASIGADLPTRVEAAMLFANIREQLVKDWHWTNETHDSDASFAWYCHFNSGYQDFSHKVEEGAAVAVRRFVLQSFNTFEAEAKRCTESLNELRASALAILSACDGADQAVKQIAAAA